ncbi:MAG TPA: (Fe-S)-binding protein, partial [Actinomycetota bacterium]|nr:(Fe-S)-binding protein [Actinomycetota bacterium]
IQDGWQSDEVAEALDLCLSCKGCKRDCPVGVDMATYKTEFLAQRYRGRRRPAAHYSMGALPRWLHLVGKLPARVVDALNAAARGPLGAVAKRVGGIAPERAIPPIARRRFTRRGGLAASAVGSGVRSMVALLHSHRSKATMLSSPGADRPRLLLWPDTFTDHFSPAVGQAAVRVLEDAGYQVDLLDEPLCCALTWISTGQLDTAKRVLRHTVDRLAALVGDAGPAGSVAHSPLVGLEPSCLAVLRHDAAALLGADDPAVVVVARAAATLAEVLATTPGWVPPDLSGVVGVAQPHCHQHAVLGWEADRDLLARAGAEVTAVGGCCGLAGNFGAERGHYDVSVAVAETALLPAVRAAGPDAVVLADGFSCRTQLDHLAGRRALHLAELLARPRR